MTSELRTAEVIAVGSELLGSTRLDTNSLFISRTLAALGIQLKAKAVVGDDRALLKDLFALAITRSDVVVVTGGLGPTDDDLTREAVTDALGISMSEDAAITATIRERFARRAMVMPEFNRKQAMVPEGATVLANPNGSAPGLLIPVGEKLAILLPGPPRELQPMLTALCEPQGLLGARGGVARLHTVSIFTTGLSESHVEQLVQPLYAPWRDSPEPIETTILATPGQVELHLTLRSAEHVRAKATLESARAELTKVLGLSAFSTDGRQLPHVVGELLQSRGLTLAAAESCTGGLLMARMTEVAGSSAYVRGGVVAYSNELKVQLLGVDPATIAAHGAVSEPTAAAMADGIHDRTGADVCVAITGIAGPSGATETKPVGTVVIAVRITGRPLSVRTHLFPGGRDLVRLQATQTSLDAVRRSLLSASASS
ncbi:MAG TPA: competence/damage-inducible protein A [Vicinamibacterales bacterium]|nr:competence/damage-inducible protein A [Vicinamibacterales bacterium]